MGSECMILLGRKEFRINIEYVFKVEISNIQAEILQNQAKHMLDIELPTGI